MFRKRRMRLRHAVLPVLAITAAYGFFARPAADSQVVPPVIIAAADSNAAPVSPNAAEQPHSFGVLNMKDAFDAKPVAPGDSFAAAQAATSAAPVRLTEETGAKPVAAAAPQAQAMTAEQLAFIQNGINKLLKAGTNLLDSQKLVKVGKGDTLMDLLVRNAVPRDQAVKAISAMRKVYDPRDLNPGHHVTVFFHKDPSIADPQFVGLRIEQDNVNSLLVKQAEDGSFRVNQEAKSVHREMKGFKGKINDSLFVDAKAGGVPDAVILDFIKLFSVGVDFQREVQTGDSFEIMYEQYITDDGTVVPNKGNIVYAKMGLSDRVMPLYRYEEADGSVEYFDNAGQSVKKPLMKTPVDGARISSGFGFRIHPVLGYNKMHKGIDFAAPRGTPIYAAGDGVIERAGPFSSYGNYVEIRHRAGLETAYGHMNAVKAGIRAGTRVKQGQVIGYVGSTGRATGPHLHYEILINHVQVNPATVKLAGGNALSGKDLKSFKSLVAKRDGEFAAALRPAASTMPVASNDVPATIKAN